VRGRERESERERKRGKEREKKEREREREQRRRRRRQVYLSHCPNIAEERFPLSRENSNGKTQKKKSELVNVKNGKQYD
jgi:hypothetical protein